MFVQVDYSGFIIYSLKGTEANGAGQPRHFIAVDNTHFQGTNAREKGGHGTCRSEIRSVKFEVCTTWAVNLT